MLRRLLQVTAVTPPQSRSRAMGAASAPRPPGPASHLAVSAAMLATAAALLLLLGQGGPLYTYQAVGMVFRTAEMQASSAGRPGDDAPLPRRHVPAGTPGCPTAQQVAASPWARSCYHVTKACVDQGRSVQQVAQQRLCLPGRTTLRKRQAGWERVRSAAAASDAPSCPPCRRRPGAVWQQRPAKALWKQGGPYICCRGRLRPVQPRLSKRGAHRAHGEVRSAGGRRAGAGRQLLRR